MRLHEVSHATARRFTRGHFNPHWNLTIQYRGRTFELEHGSGTNATDTVYRDGTCVYVLSVDRRMGDCALARFDLASEPEPANDEDSPDAKVLRPAWDVFLPNAGEQLADYSLSARGRPVESWDDWSPRHLARVLMQADNG